MFHIILAAASRPFLHYGGDTREVEGRPVAPLPLRHPEPRQDGVNHVFVEALEDQIGPHHAGTIDVRPEDGEVVLHERKVRDHELRRYGDEAPARARTDLGCEVGPDPVEGREEPPHDSLRTLVEQVAHCAVVQVERRTAHLRAVADLLDSHELEVFLDEEADERVIHPLRRPEVLALRPVQPWPSLCVLVAFRDIARELEDLERVLLLALRQVALVQRVVDGDHRDSQQPDDDAARHSHSARAEHPHGEAHARPQDERADDAQGECGHDGGALRLGVKPLEGGGLRRVLRGVFVDE